MKWLVTGGAGFIGSHAAARFLRRGDEVVVLDSLARTGALENLAWLKEQGLQHFERADVREPEALHKVFARHHDAGVVLHLAAQVAVTHSVANPRLDFEVNALGTFNVLEAVRTAAGGRPAVFYGSTNKVFGALEDLAIKEEPKRYILAGLPRGVTEERPLDFHSPYGCSKGAADQYVRDYARIYGLRTVVFRQSCIYGTRQWGVEDQGWVAWFCIAAALKRPLTVYGNGKQVRDLLWIDDLLDLYERAAERLEELRGEVFNVGGGPENTLSLLELLDWLGKGLDCWLAPQFAAPRPGDQKVFVADTAKAERKLGWRPQVSKHDGIERLLRWVRENKKLFG